MIDTTQLVPHSFVGPNLKDNAPRSHEMRAAQLSLTLFVPQRYADYVPLALSGAEVSETFVSTRDLRVSIGVGYTTVGAILTTVAVPVRTDSWIPFAAPGPIASTAFLSTLDVPHSAGVTMTQTGAVVSTIFVPRRVDAWTSVTFVGQTRVSSTFLEFTSVLNQSGAGLRSMYWS